MHGRQMLISVTLMVFAELASGISLALEYGGHGDISFLPTFFSARHANFCHARSHRCRAADEGCAASRTALLGVVVREADTLFSNAVDVWRLVAHHAAIVVADVPSADIVTPNDEDVGLLIGRIGRQCCKRNAIESQEGSKK